MNTLWTLLQDPNMQWILISCTLLGLSSGIIGCFSYLRKQSLMGDTLAHAALPGICIAFMLTGTKSILYFLIGAGIAGVAATFGIGWITRHSRVKHDAAMGIVLSSFFGLGIVLLTIVQHGGYGNQAGLDKFLFGQAASMVGSDVLTLSIVSLLLVSVCYLLFKQFKLVSFDPGFAKGLGYPVAILEQLLMFLMVVAVVVGIQAVGVILVASLIITPAVSSRYWTDRLGVMVVVSGIFGALSGATGAIVSSTGASLPTGPLTVLAATLLFVVSLLIGTKRGLLVRRLAQQRMKRRLGYGFEEQAATASVDDRINKEAAL
ncbi:metal ABC transporter permease [Paenibacillus glycanilyticus]|uniref:Manganese ABC transporter n=1 Tax=Paenibacillus glycanilyticus TaxID=126569 RepID=A0ABQ6G5Z2_9BACL|nr:metal ABC transporter permease [Paenibacillus glycanilyticus]GLX65937.1 hypothetical protein MU1_02810 [Paenibacillus glycanilyticus]